MNTITEIIEIEKRKLADQIIENNFTTLEDGYKSIRWYGPCKIDYNSDVEVETQIIEYYQDQIKHSKKVLKVIRECFPENYCIINQLIRRLEYCKTQVKNTRKYN
jgi:hypothetical protein